MRTPRLLAAFLLLSASFPAEAVSQIRSAKPIASPTPALSVLSVTGAGLPVNFSTPLSLSLSPSLSLSAPSLSVQAAPALQAAVPPASIRSVAVAVPRIDAVKPSPLSVRVEAASALTRALPDIPLAAAPAAAAQSFSLLTGEALIRRADSLPVLPAPSAAPLPSLAPSTPHDPSLDPEKNVRRMMIGTSVLKSGMETVTLSIPLLALTALGGASMVAALVVVYGISQAVFAGAAGSLADRFPARKVLAGAIIAQAALVAAVVAIGAAGALSAATLLPLYVLIGGAVGIAETTRHSIPALILGQDTDALNRYNARLHIAYQVAGVGGALAAGALIAFAGPLWSLLLQPPAYLLASYLFLRVRHGRPVGIAPAAKGGVWDKVKTYGRDVAAGARIIAGDKRLRWVGLAFVLPQIAHRVFESLLIPVFAKSVLESPQSSAWLLTASNLGELLGAVVLLKLASRFKGPTVWVKYGALGLLLIWALASTHSLPMLLPLILVSSLTWAASDLTLRSDVQASVSEKDQPRAQSFLFSAYVLGSAAASFALAGAIDALGVGPALIWICAGITALAAAVFLASRRLGR